MEEYGCGAFLWTVHDKCVSVHIEDIQGRELVSASYAYRWDRDKKKIKLLTSQHMPPKVLRGWLRVCKAGDKVELWNSKEESVALLTKLNV